MPILLGGCNCLRDVSRDSDGVDSFLAGGEQHTRKARETGTPAAN